MNQKQKEVFWNQREFSLFIKNVADKNMRFAFELIYQNGIAITDIFRLRIKDFNMYQGFVCVSDETIRHEQLDNNIEIQLPDNYQVDIFEEQKEKIQKYLEDFADYEQEEYIFQISRQRLEREFYNVIEKNTIRKMQINKLAYCQRHTYQDQNGKIYCLAGYSEEKLKSMNGYGMENNGKMGVPIWKKLNLTLAEAAEYSGIGINNLRKLCDEKENVLVLWIGTKRLIKRKKLEEITEQLYTL